MDALTFQYEQRAGTTTMTIQGSVRAEDCGTLRDGLDLACMLHPSGPILIDLGRVERLAVAALVILDQASESARRKGRVVSVRNLHHEHITDPASLRVLAAAP